MISQQPDVIDLIRAAKQEDLGSGDITAALMESPAQPAKFNLIAKQAGVFAGNEIAAAILAEYDSEIEIEWTDQGRDGFVFSDGPTTLATLTGPLSAVLSAERVLLNFLQRLCGVATATNRYVQAIVDTSAKVYDTRKTTPGWRSLEKYAVRCGQGFNHRTGLFDAILIKDNHLAGVTAQRFASTIFDLLNRIDPSVDKPTFVEVEVDNLDQYEQLFKVVGVDIILLDNFSLEDLETAVALRNEQDLQGKVELEASGGITLDTIRAVAMTGVDRISVGAITHSATALDLSLERILC